MTNASRTPASEEASSVFVDTPYGMMTAAGRWYHITEEDVRDYAGAVLDHVSLDQLVQWADAWVDSPRTVTLWALPLLLWGLPVAWAAGGALVLYVAWTLASPAWPGVGAARVASWLRSAVVQGLYYVATLSVFAAMENYAAVGVGLAAFVLFRWGVVEWVLQKGLRPLCRWIYPLPVTDQVLRGLIVRAALKYRVSVPQVDAITGDILDNWGAQSDADDRPSTENPSH
jgi:hypothetical protein